MERARHKCSRLRKYNKLQGQYYEKQDQEQVKQSCYMYDPFLLMTSFVYSF